MRMPAIHTVVIASSVQSLRTIRAIRSVDGIRGIRGIRGSSTTQRVLTGDASPVALPDRPRVF
jgi:hypothetical protein